MDKIEQKKCSGGVSGDTLRSTVEAVFSGWKDWADESEHSIKTYTSLEQIGLSDADMSPDDFTINIRRIDDSIILSANPSIIIVRLWSTINPNFTASVFKKILEDLSVSATIDASWVLKIERFAFGSRGNVKIELVPNLNRFNDKSITAYYNRDGDVVNIYPFRETAYVERYAGVIELLNGWEIRNYFVIEKIGNLVNVNFIIHKGVRDHGTIIFVLPPEYRPKASISVPTPYTGIATSTISFGFNGNVIIYGWHESTDGYFIVSASYVVD